MKSPKRKLPFYVPILTGLFLVTIGSLVLVTALGLIPTTSQDFHSPRWMVGAIGAGLLFGGVVIWLPKRAPQWISTGLGMTVWLILLLVLNYTALSPGQSPIPGELAVGPFLQSPVDPTSSRLMVGTLAAVADAYSVWWVIKRFWKRSPGGKNGKEIKNGEKK